MLLRRRATPIRHFYNTYRWFLPAAAVPNTAVVSELRKQVGVRLRELRLARGLTQEALAERSELSYKFVGEVERGSANPTLDTLDRLARALEIGIGELIPAGQPLSAATVSASDYAIVRDALTSLQNVFERVAPKRRQRRSRQVR